MPDPFAPLLDIARRGLPFAASDGQACVRLIADSLGLRGEPSGSARTAEYVPRNLRLSPFAGVVI